MKKWLPLISLVTVLVFLAGLAMPALAGYGYYIPIRVYNNSTTDYGPLPVLVDINSAQLAVWDYIDADGLDTDVLEGASDRGFMVSSLKLPIFVSSILGKQTRTYNYRLGDTDGQTGFPIMVGVGGNITVEDNDANLEVGSNFTIEQSGWIDTDYASDKNLVYKQDAFRTYISAATNITSEVAAVATYSPDAHPEGASVDGYVEYINAGGVSWDAIHDAVDGTGIADDGNIGTIQIGCDANNNEYDYLRRSYLLFDTGPLPDGVNILSATLAIYGVGKISDYADASVNVYSSSPATETALVIGDYNQVGTTPFSTAIIYADYEAADWNTFTLNVSGLAAINSTGISKFSIREATYDAADVPPAWADGDEIYFYFECAEHAGGHDPILTIAYTDVVVTATGVASGEHTVVTRADKTFLELLVDTENELWNSNFEVGDPPTGWTAVGVILSRETSPTPKAGSYVMKVLSDDKWVTAQNSVPNYAEYAGEEVTFGIWCYAPSANDKSQRIAVLDGIVAETISAIIPKDDTWHWTTVTMTLNASPSYLKVYLYANYSSTVDTDDILYADGAILVGGDTIPQTPPCPVTAALAGASVPDNNNGWVMMENDVAPYLDYVEVDIDGVQKLRFEPNTMILATSVPDRSVNGNTGTIHWGANPSGSGIEVFVGGLIPFSAYVAPVGEEADIPIILPSPEGLELFETPDADVTGLPAYALVSRFSDSVGWTVQIGYSVLMLITAIGIGFGAMIATGTIWGFAIGFGVTAATAGGTGVLPLWIAFLAVLFVILGAYAWSHT